jgi:hypothetical protein
MKSPILSVAMGPHFFVPLGSGTAEVFTQFADEAHRSRIPSRDAGRGGSKGIGEFHFTAEEGLLEKTNYSGLLTHRAQHQDFIKRIDQFQKDLAGGKAGNSIRVLEFLKGWLAKHIK